MRTVELRHILLEYDYPQVFVGSDAIGGQYVCMAVEERESGPLYLVAPVSRERCEDLLVGRVDLLSIYKEPQIPEFYTCLPDDLTADFRIEPYSIDVITDEWLPDPGLFFEHTDTVLNKAKELAATVAYASLSVPEAKTELRIRSKKLSEFLAIYQSVLRHLARAGAKHAGKKIPKGEDPYEVDVFGTCFGSFTVQVRSADPCDMLGDNKALVVAFQMLNEFLDLADKPASAMSFLLGVKGHAASALVNLLTFIAENDCPFSNAWSTPTMVSSSRGRIRVATARNVIERCKQREDLGVETLELTGVVDSAKVSTSSWSMHVEGETYSGGVKEGIDLNLSGITVGNRYTFVCEERIEVVQGTGREKRIISLIRFIAA